ncbi:MAG: hypothetical protein WBE79_04580 [Candidatus Cybelea sp.]
MAKVSQLLGHSSPVITLSTYAHVLDGVAREAVNVLANSLIRARQGRTTCEQMAYGHRSVSKAVRRTHP